MAENPYVNKVEKADGTTIMDITDTTAEENDVLSGEVFYKSTGQRSTGTLSDFTGATASADGTHGLVPAPEAGEQDKVLSGAGTWEYMSASSKEFTLDTVTNTSGSYSHTTTVSGVTADMKPIKIELGTPSAFNDRISITCSDGSITLSCDNVSGSSTVKVTVLKQANVNGTVSSEEFDTLAGRIGTLTNLTTTDKTSTVAAINELDTDISTINSKLSITEIASNTTILSMCQNAPADIVSNYRLLDAVSVSDYPSAMTTAGGIYVRYVSIKKHGGVGYITITACNNAGKPFNICGYRINDSIIWGSVL